MSNAPTIHGRGLTLRPIVPERDAGVLHDVFGDRTQLAYMLRSPCETESDTAALLQRWNEELASPQWAIVHDGLVVGRVTLVSGRKRILEVGIQVVPSAQGRGVATNAIVVATAHGLGELSAGRIFADIDPANVPCSRAFLRAGFRFEGTLVSNWFTDAGVFDSEIYAATASWSAPP